MTVSCFPAFPVFCISRSWKLEVCAELSNLKNQKKKKSHNKNKIVFKVSACFMLPVEPAVSGRSSFHQFYYWEQQACSASPLPL